MFIMKMQFKNGNNQIYDTIFLRSYIYSVLLKVYLVGCFQS